MTDTKPPVPPMAANFQHFLTGGVPPIANQGSAQQVASVITAHAPAPPAQK